MKKVLSAVAVVALMTGALVGCTSTESSSSMSQSSTTTSSQPNPVVTDYAVGINKGEGVDVTLVTSAKENGLYAAGSSVEFSVVLFVFIQRFFSRGYFLCKDINSLFCLSYTIMVCKKTGEFLFISFWNKGDKTCDIGYCLCLMRSILVFIFCYYIVDAHIFNNNTRNSYH